MLTFRLVFMIAFPFLVRFFLSNLVGIVLSVAQPEVIYAHARNLTSGFLTNLLEMPLNVGLQPKCSCLIGNRGRLLNAESISGDKFATGSRINVLTAHAQTSSSQKWPKWCRNPEMTASL